LAPFFARDRLFPAKHQATVIARYISGLNQDDGNDGSVDDVQLYDHALQSDDVQ